MDADDDKASAISAEEDDTLGVGADSQEEGNDDSSAPLITGFNPSSFDLSFLVENHVPDRGRQSRERAHLGGRRR